jgi:predicted phosphoribosyltransferase
MIFLNREDAGRKLALALARFKGKNAVVYGIPRGGVVLAVEVAKALGADLDVVVVRKIGHPDNPEYAIGAVSATGHHVENAAETRLLGSGWFPQACRTQQKEAQRRYDLFSAGRKAVTVQGRPAILVDDGLATGLTMSLAVREVRHRGPSELVIAVPVASREAVSELRGDAGNIVALYIPPELGSIGAFYEDFTQVSDADVLALIRGLDRGTS